MDIGCDLAQEYQAFVRTEAATGAIVYLPPQAADVPRLMADLIARISTAEREELPAPVIAEGWLEVADPARKSRRYRLSAEYRQFIGEITAVT